MYLLIVGVCEVWVPLCGLTPCKVPQESSIFVELLVVPP